MASGHCSSTGSTSDKEVELGFAEKASAWKLKSKFFPSKIGGKPAWLNLRDLPDPSDLKCRKCEQPCVFLLQVYAPFDGEENFHRTIFLFMCKNGKCCKRNNCDNFIVLRNQLPRRNDFYSYEPPIESEKDSNSVVTEPLVTLCDVCGCRGPLRCEKCIVKSYCGPVHQRMDWDSGHRSICEATSVENGKCRKKHKNKFLLPEFELVTETEQLPIIQPEKSEEERMQEFQNFMKSSKAPSNSDNISAEDIDYVTKKNDKVFNKFQKRVAHEPEQVLRYERHGHPLWVSAENVILEEDIPLCKCGAKRFFEFQIMPQLLNYIALDTKQDSVDWGTILVYTCSKSCLAGQLYTPEFVWKQDFSNDKF